jgi:Flp pilus assembly pilin Flp
MNFLKKLWREDDGQDLVEYTLLLAFVVVMSAALLLTNQEAINTIWGVTNDNLSAARSVIQ